MAKKMGYMETAFRQAAGPKLPSTAAKKGPISEGGTAALGKSKPRKVTGGGFAKLKKLFGEM